MSKNRQLKPAEISAACLDEQMRILASRRHCSTVAAAKLMGCSRQTVIDRVHAGVLFGFKLGGQWCISLDSVYDYLGFFGEARRGPAESHPCA